MMNNVAFGAGKAGTGFDPITYITRPQVILRFVCWLFSIIVWCCISFNGWTTKGRREVCLYNGENAACRFGSTVGFIGFLAATAFLALEAFFQNISSIKVRRRAVLGDIGFSAAWAILYLFVFGYLAIAWGKADYPYMGKGINNCRAAVAFSLFSIATWAACAYLAYLRWQEGADLTQFTSGFDQSAFQQPNQTGDGYAPYTDDGTGGGGSGGYTSYTTGADGGADPGYASNPFTAMAAQEATAYQQPSY